MGYDRFCWIKGWRHPDGPIPPTAPRSAGRGDFGYGTENAEAVPEYGSTNGLITNGSGVCCGSELGTAIFREQRR